MAIRSDLLMLQRIRKLLYLAVQENEMQSLVAVDILNIVNGRKVEIVGLSRSFDIVATRLCEKRMLSTCRLKVINRVS